MKSGFIAKLHQYSQPGLYNKQPQQQPSTLKKGISSGQVNSQQAQQGSNSNIKILDDQINENMAPRDRISALMKQNFELQAKEQRYIEKLSRLQQGLEQQYVESMKLQELYSDLLDSYKAKEQQIQQLEMRYRVYEESEKRRLDVDPALDAMRKDSQHLQDLLEEHKLKINDLQRKLDEANNLLVANKILNSRNEQIKACNFSSKYIDKIISLQKENDMLKQSKITLDCENNYLKSRNRDLETYRHHLDRLTVGKQQEISRLRDEKVNLLRNEPDRRYAMSPRSHSPRETSPGKHSEKFRALQQENRLLKGDLEDARLQIAELNSIVAIQREKLYSIEQPSPIGNIKHDDFFSFSKEQLQQRGYQRMIQKKPQERDYQKASQYEWLKQEQQDKGSGQQEHVETSATPLQSQTRRHPKEDDHLPPFPKELQIQNLIRTLQKANERENSRWEVADQ